jgi:methylmalonyl-CoA mutase
MRKDIQHIKLEQSKAASPVLNEQSFLTAENIELKQTYSEQDI